VLALLCLFVVAISADLRKEFDDWKQTHNKVYKADEEQLRFRNFVASLRKIALLNSNSSGATYGLNQFSDMSPVEFKRLYKMQNGIRSNGIHPEFVKPEGVAAPPQSIDWRTQGVVTPVKNQEQCGSCWAFSTTEAIESAWMIAKNQKVATFKPLGPQQIVDCDNSDGGCNGGNPPTAYAYVISAGGQETETAYPYTGEDGTCNFKAADVEVKISNWKYATSEYDEETLKTNVADKGPLSICVDAANWQYYTSGVMTAWECAWVNELDHCVQAVGYDLTGATPYWLVRNSWGTSWGESGYIRLQYGDNTCGLTNEATYAIV